MNVPVQVECYSGHTYAQEPRAFEWRGERYEVVRVVKRWRTPTGPAFRVESTAIPNTQSPISKQVDLFYQEIEDIWTMTVRP